MKSKIRYYSILLIGILLVQSLLPWTNIQKAYSTGTIYTFLQKIRKSKSIIFAKFIEASDEEFEILDPSGNSYGNVKVPKYAYYEVLEVMKGNYNEDTLKVNFQKINARYKAVRGAGIVTPNDSGIVLFMFEKDGYTFKGDQGKIDIESSELDSYKEAVRLSIEFDKLDNSAKLDKIIEYLGNKPILKRSMLSELHRFDNNKYGVKISTLLYNDDPVVRKWALLTLRGTRIKSLVPIIIKLSQDPSSYVRSDAAIVLGSMEDDRAENALRNLTKDSSYDVRVNAINYLSKTPENLNIFLIALNDPSNRVKRAAADGLEKMESEESTDAMISMLSDTDSVGKKFAIAVLSNYGSAEAISAISILLTDNDANTQNDALLAMFRISRRHPDIMNDPKIIEHIIRIVDDSKSVRHKMTGLRLLGMRNVKEALPLLKKNLIHENPKIRIVSARAIVSMREVSLIDHMENILKNEKNKKVVIQLERAISSLRSGNSGRR